MFYLESNNTVRPVRADLTVCSSFRQRLTGALLAGKIPFRKGYLFPGVRSVHTWFMRSSISVLAFDRDGRILNYSSKLTPFRFFVGSKRTAGILELAPGRVKVDSDHSIRFPASVAESADLENLSYTGPSSE